MNKDFETAVTIKDLEALIARLKLGLYNFGREIDLTPENARLLTSGIIELKDPDGIPFIFDAFETMTINTYLSEIKKVEQEIETLKLLTV